MRKYNLCIIGLFATIGHIVLKGNNAVYISYNKLWKLLIDKNLKRTDLIKLSGISTSSLAKLGKNKNITTDVLLKICKALQCDISDIMQIAQMQEIKNDH